MGIIIYVLNFKLQYAFFTASVGMRNITIFSWL